MTFGLASKLLSTPLQASRRRQILQQPLTEQQKEIFELSLEAWRSIDRTSLAGYHSLINNPVNPLTSLAPFCTEGHTNTIGTAATTTTDISTAKSKKDKVNPLCKISIFHGPVTELDVDAIVNAANEVCLGGGGVDGAIHAAAGPLLQRECATFPGCPTGQSIITKGYNLPARYVIHTVGPVGEKPQLLTSCYRSLLNVARQHQIRTLGVCGISTGVYGYPLHAACRIAVNEVVQFILQYPDTFDQVCFACFHAREADAIEAELKRIRDSTTEKIKLEQLK